MLYTAYNIGSGYIIIIMLKSFIIKKLLKSVTENVLFYKYYLHIPRTPPWSGVVSSFFSIFFLPQSAYL